MDALLSAAQRPRLRRRLFLFFGLAFVPVVFVSGYLYVRYSSERDLADAIAEADRLDPNWRLADLEAHRPEVPYSENAFLQAQNADRLLPRPWPSWRAYSVPGETEEALRARRALHKSLMELESPVRLNEAQTTALRQELQRVRAALTEARKLADMPRGIQHLNWNLDKDRLPLRGDYISIRITANGGGVLQDSPQIRSVEYLLHYDALLLAEERNLTQSLRSARAVLNCGRSLGEEPTAISQLIRAASDKLAWSTIERILAQGEPGRVDLLAAQRALEEEAEEPLLYYALRGERAGADRFLESVQSGELPFRHIRELLHSVPSNGRDPLSDNLETLNLTLAAREQRANVLHYMNQLVEIARLAPEEQVPRLKEMKAAGTRQLPSWFIRLTGPLPGELGQAANRIRAQLRCASAALAAECYRQDHGRWPETLGGLVPQYLARIPLDPFGGRPLKLGKHAQGIVIYSVGFDGEDNGGAINVKSPMAAGSDLGFRLWDCHYRRQSP
jgi:hypothetical protein